MKILVVHNGYKTNNIGGEDIAVKKEIAALRQYSHHPTHEYFVSNDDIRLPTLATRIWGNQTHAHQIKKLVAQEGIDIVHVHNFFPVLTPLVFRAAKEAGAKVVHTLHNYRWWCLSGTLFRNNQACEQCLRKKIALSGITNGCYRNSVVQSAVAGSAFAWYQYQHFLDDIDLFFVLSEFAQDKLSGLLPKEKLKIKPNLVDISTDHVVPVENKKEYLYVGRLEQAKGIELLLSVWRTLPNELHLNVIGAGVDEQRLREQYACSNIHFLGKQSHEDTLTAMAQARYLIHPSLAYETFGLTLLEAMSMGTPVIALDVGPRKELVFNNQNGFLTTPEYLKETILTSAQTHAYENLSHNARAFSQNFSAKVVVAKQIRFYQEIAFNP